MENLGTIAQNFDECLDLRSAEITAKHGPRPTDIVVYTNKNQY